MSGTGGVRRGGREKVPILRSMCEKRALLVREMLQYIKSLNEKRIAGKGGASVYTLEY